MTTSDSAVETTRTLMVELINRTLLDRLGLKDAVGVLGVDPALRLIEALKDVPVKTVEVVRYYPEPDTRRRPYQDWWHSQPMCGAMGETQSLSQVSQTLSGESTEQEQALPPPR